MVRTEETSRCKIKEAEGKTEAAEESNCGNNKSEKKCGQEAVCLQFAVFGPRQNLISGCHPGSLCGTRDAEDPLAFQNLS